MLLSLLVLAACASKNPDAMPSASAAASPGAERPLLLWRVERDGHASHLLGTCHIAVSLDDALPKPHDAALADARIVYTEAALDVDDPARIVRLLWSDGPGLSTRISDDRWRAVAIAVRDTLPAPLLEHLEPWALASILPMLTSPAGLGAVTGDAMDLDVQKRAKARDIPLAHVETLEQQAGMLREWNDSFLATLGPSEDDGAAESEALTALCMRGETEGMDVLVQPGDPTSEALLGARNRAWMPTLAPALAGGGVFVAVGAAHMLGESGLLALLEADGYAITQLTTTRAPSDARMPPASARIAPAPPVPANLDATATAIAAPLAAAMCADGQVMRTCFEPDAARCTERLTTDGELCVRQFADLLPAAGERPSASLNQRLAGCVPAGLVVEAVGRDRVGDGPICAMLKTAMKGAVAK